VASKPLLTIFAIAPFGLPSRSDLNEIAQSKQKRLKFHNLRLHAFASIHSRYQSAICNPQSKIKKREPISKMRIRVQGKARVGEKAEHTRKYVSILSRSATQP
jgi:hypothetical protein